MGDQKIEYAILPWRDQLTAGRILPVLVGLLAAYCIFEYFFKKFNYSMRRGTLSLITNTVWPILINTCIYTVAYWRWAIPLSAVIGLIFVSVLFHELKVAHDDEMEGFRGVNPEMRKLRAEAFADMTIEEQMAYKKSVKPVKFYWYIFLPLVVAIPFLIVLLLEQLGVGDYLFHVIYY